MQRGNGCHADGSIPAGAPSSARWASPAARASTPSSSARGSRSRPASATIRPWSPTVRTTCSTPTCSRPSCRARRRHLTADERLDLVYDLKQRPPRSIGAELNYETDSRSRAATVLGAPQHLRRRRAVPRRDRRRRAAAVADDEPAQARLPAAEPEPADRRVDPARSARGLRRRLDRRRSRASSARSASSSRSRSAPPALCADRGPEGAGAVVRAPVLPRQGRLGFRQRPVQPDQRRHAGHDRDPFRGSARHQPQVPQGSDHHHALPVTELVTAAWFWPRAASIGALGGVSRDDVPADERFYAGGGGSIRGIGFELAGPLDEDDKPLGGRSVIEGSIELRTRWGENNFGVALFLDAGTVDTSGLPEPRGAGAVRRRPEPALLHAGGADPLRHRLSLESPQGCRLRPTSSTSASDSRSETETREDRTLDLTGHMALAAGDAA